MQSTHKANRLNKIGVGLLLLASLIFHVQLALRHKKQETAPGLETILPEDTYCQQLLPPLPLVLLPSEKSRHHKPI